MATWTNITDAALEPGRPIRSVDGLALRDNAIAIAEGAVGAPLIDGAQSPAIRNGGIPNGEVGAEKFQTGTTERDWVLARTASASVGAVGAYAMLNSNGTQLPGATRAGSLMSYSNGIGSSSGINAAGTWRCMGYSNDSSTDSGSTLWLRIA